ncbi:ATP-binding protein [Olsenella urininfantis]|uniref:ATP-binding protein n=1 Tax=Olsenella urininfantis TaxID=1871033 RepID=UPI0009867602|nr:ATP-binding protein [Olsenella urininfantis]
MRAFFDHWWSLEIVIQLMVPIYLLSRRLPRRPGTTPRLLLSTAALGAAAVLPLAAGIVRGLNAGQTFSAFSTLLAVFALVIMFCYEVGPWAALSCATAGYTLQNISSGVSLLLQMLITGRALAPLGEPLATLVSFGTPLVVYAVGYLAFVRRIGRNGLSAVENKMMLLMFVVVIFVIIGLDVVIKALTLSGIPFRYLILLRLAHASICCFVLFAEYQILYAKRMSDAKAETEHLLAERERQYRLSRENIEAINLKCHDIRHQIRHLADRKEVVDGQALVDIAREVKVYDSVVETGNEALDTILTEKSLACSQDNIVLSCIADGQALSFMAASDIYSLFGNALDNAIRAVSRMEDRERRSITLTVRQRGQMVALSIENYSEVLPSFRDGMPLADEAGDADFGFGTRAMRSIVERYDGILHMGASDGIFYLNALLPMPEEKS